MIFTSDAALHIEKTVMDAVISYIENALSQAPYLALFAQYAPPGVLGVQVSDDEKDVPDVMASFRPFVWLSVPEGGHERETYREIVDGQMQRGNEHSFEILCELFVSPAALLALRDLRESLQQIFDTSDNDRRELLRELGLTGVEFKPDNARSQSGNYVNPHTLRFVAYSLP